MANDNTKRCDRMALIHPEAKRQFKLLHERLGKGFLDGETKTRFGVFETYRHPERQNFLLKQGTTKASAYMSAHQYGLAVDFVPFDYARDLNPEMKYKQIGGNRLWNWRDDNDYEYLKRCAQEYGLDVPILWDKCHVEHPLYWQLRELL